MSQNSIVKNSIWRFIFGPYFIVWIIVGVGVQVYSDSKVKLNRESALVKIEKGQCFKLNGQVYIARSPSKAGKLDVYSLTQPFEPSTLKLLNNSFKVIKCPKAQLKELRGHLSTKPLIHGLFKSTKREEL